MRQPVQQQINRQMTAQTASAPAPIGGWNARDSYAAMDQKDAVTLINWWPTTSDVQARQGYTQYATGFPGNVNTVMAFNIPGLPTAKKLFAASTNSIYDISNGGAIGAPVLTGMTSDVWSYVNFSTPGGSFLVLANGADPVQEYNGTTWSVPAITGVSSSLLIHVQDFKQRLFFIERNSLRAWYLPTSSIAGAASQLDFGSVFRRGGTLQSMGVWTLDGGYGMDDYACWITSEGEIAVYKGTDPSQATTWSLVGVYQIGTPLGNQRCFMKYGGDLLVVSKDGLAPMSSALSSTRVNSQIDFTYKIQNAISNATTTYAGNFGWCMQLYPPVNMVILNVPVAAGQEEQYVMNTITGSWSQFKGWHARCWEIWNDDIYFGSGGYVGKAWSGLSDAGANIQCQALQAFSYFGSSLQKHFTLARPILNTTGTPAINISVNVDFDTSQPDSIPTFSPVSAALWDSAIWDLSMWGGDGIIKKDWDYVGAVGFAGAMAINAAISGTSLRWSATDYVFTTGGVL